MHEQLFEEGELFTVKGVELQILSVGNHQVDGEPAGFSYSFRVADDIKKDAEVAATAEAE